MTVARMKLLGIFVVAIVLQIASTQDTESSTQSSRKQQGRFITFGKGKWGAGTSGGGGSANWNNKGGGLQAAMKPHHHHGGIGIIGHHHHHHHGHGHGQVARPYPWRVKWGGKNTDQSCWVYVETDEAKGSKKPHRHAAGEKHEHGSKEKHGSSEEKQKDGQAGRGFGFFLKFGPGDRKGSSKDNSNGNKGGSGNWNGGKGSHHHHHDKSKHDKKPRGYWRYDESKCNNSQKTDSKVETKPEMETGTVSTTERINTSPMPPHVAGEHSTTEATPIEEVAPSTTEPPPVEEVAPGTTQPPPVVVTKPPGPTQPPPVVRGKEKKVADVDEDLPEAKDGDMVPDYSGSDESEEKKAE